MAVSLGLGVHHGFERSGECIPPYQRRRLKSMEFRAEACFSRNITILTSFSKSQIRGSFSAGHIFRAGAPKAWQCLPYSSTLQSDI